MNIGEVIAEHFEVRFTSRWQTPRGVDRRTGGQVLFLDPPFTLDRIGARTVTRLELWASEPRIARAASTDPWIVAVPKSVRRPAASRLRDAALGLLELTVSLAPLGIGPIAEHAVVPADRAREVWVPVGPMKSGLQTKWRRFRYLHNPVFAVQEWVDKRLPNGQKLAVEAGSPRSIALELVRRLGASESARVRAEALPDSIQVRSLPIDFDLAIDALELDLARDTLRVRATEDSGHALTAYPLAAALHHRACERASTNQAYLADLQRAIELDRHPSYLTTLALLQERDGHPGAAETHDAAVAAIAEIEPTMTMRNGIAYEELRFQTDPADVAQRHAARTLHARGVFRAKHGDLTGARADLEASLGKLETDGARRWLAWLNAQPRVTGAV